MITKERLQWLIDNEVFVYAVVGDKVYELPLSKHDWIGEQDGNVLYSNYNCNADYYTYRLFETKEDAEWQREFGCIERTERLKLPTWEKVNEIIEEQKWFELNFKTKQEEIAFIVNDCQIAVMMKGENYLSGSDDELNKENYIKACREVKKLFLGEEFEE